MSAYGYDDEGEREHDCCDRCGRGSCPGSGSQGEDACNDHLRRRRPAPPLSPEEKATVQRFETAPDPFADEYNGFIVGPDDTLVLIAEHLSAEQAAETSARIPARLHGRVVVVCGLDAKVIRGGA